MTESKRTRHTLFDDTFRTIEQECDDALIYFVNRMFKEHYTRTAKVEHLRNEHYDHEKGDPPDHISFEIVTAPVFLCKL